MFTGLIEAKTRILSRDEKTIIIARPPIFLHLKKGASLSVNGACLSVTTYNDHKISFDIAEETWTRTNLHAAQTVNLERPMRADGRFEGHLVLGHVDATTEFLRREGEKFFFLIPEAVRDFFVKKGSVAINGVSLTIANVFPNEFSVAIIPTTLAETNFSDLVEHEIVNIEADYFAKLLRKWA